jgi:hypothetical protein
VVIIDGMYNQNVIDFALNSIGFQLEQIDPRFMPFWREGFSGCSGIFIVNRRVGRIPVGVHWFAIRKYNVDDFGYNLDSCLAKPQPIMNINDVVGRDDVVFEIRNNDYQAHQYQPIISETVPDVADPRVRAGFARDLLSPNSRRKRTADEDIEAQSSKQAHIQSVIDEATISASSTTPTPRRSSRARAELPTPKSPFKRNVNTYFLILLYCKRFY